MNSMIYRRKGPLAVFLAPAMVFLTIFLFYPFAVNIYNSFYDIKELGGNILGWNDFENYKMIFQDEKMAEAMKNTLIMLAAAAVVQVGLALILSLLVDSIRWGANFFRTVYFFPIVISATAIGLMFYLIYMPGGALDQITVPLFHLEKPVYWLSKKLAFLMITIPVLWQYVGFYFVILLTGLNGISEEIYEAAAIDGATGWQRVKLITLPLLRNVLITCLTLSVTGALKVFDLPWNILPNGAQNTFLTATYMYFVTFTKRNIDYASTIAIVIVLLGVMMAQVINRVFKPSDY